MKNYICIGGNKTALTDAQVKELGFTASSSAIEELVAIVRSGKAREHYDIRDTVTLAGEEYEIIGFNHDRDAANPTAPTITLMAKTLRHAHKWHGGACERGWIDSDLRKWLNEEYFSTLPEELADSIRPVTKSTLDYKGRAHETADRLFIPTESELFGSAICCEFEDGPRYEAFATSADRLREDEDGDTRVYWTRSAHSGSSTGVAVVDSDGTAGWTFASSSIHVPVCFLLA